MKNFETTAAKIHDGFKENKTPAEKSREREPRAESEPVDEAAMERARGALARAELIGKLKSEEMAELADRDFENAASSLESRGWQKIFSELGEGDTAVYFSMPAGDFSVKNFNDELFGQQLTDDIIDRRKKIMVSLAEHYGLEILHQDFRGGVLKPNKEKTGKSGGLKNTADILNALGLDLDGEMAKVIRETISRRAEELERALESGKITATEKNAKLGKLDNFKNKLSRWGFKATFGASRVGAPGKSGDFTSAALAVAESQQVAQILRHGEQATYGGEYDEKFVKAEIRDIFASADEIDAIIYDKNNLPFEVFQKTDGRRAINRDLVRAIRKDKFEPALGQEVLFKKIGRYIRRVNLFDLFKPYTADEISGKKSLNGSADDTLKNKVGEARRLIGLIKTAKDLNQNDRRKVAEILSADQKDGSRTSPEIFHSEAMKMREGVYISIDVVDLGVDLLLEYERLLNEVNAGKISLAEASLAAGDNTTKKMREVRAKAAEVCGKYFPNEKILTLVGGDEVTMALPNGENINGLLLELQKATSGRVVKTVVGGAERKSLEDWLNDDEDEEDSADRRLREHLSAIKRAEQGAEISKEIENMKRETELALRHHFSTIGKMPASMAERTARERLRQIIPDSFVVKEEPGGKFVILDDAGGERAREEISRELRELEKNIFEKLKTAV